jgi:hypothetical protein
MICLIGILVCGAKKPLPVVISPAVKLLQDTGRVNDSGSVNVMDFGAKGDGKTDDYLPIQTACNACIAYPSSCTRVRLPVGNYRITQSIVLQNIRNGQYAFFTLQLTGDAPNKSASNSWLSRITYDNNHGFGIGIQLGRGISIENITVLGKYQFPYKVTNRNIGTLTFDQWNDGSVVDSRNNPYAGIVIDPYVNRNGSSAGTSGVEIRQCAVKQFMVGICLTPNPVTLNDEMINIIDDDIEAVRVAIAIGQDQSKEIHIDRFKCWASTHTILDGLHYGRGTGGGSVMIEGMNIAGNVNEIFDLSTDRFPLSAKDIYSESLFRIGYVGNGAGANFINFEIDFLTGPGLPAADYLLAGQANFYGGSLRYYDNSQTHRMNLSNMETMFRDMTINNPPITAGLYGGSVYPTPQFDNVHVYYSGKTLVSHETLTQFHTTQTLVVDRDKWTGNLIVPPAILKIIQPGDYILASPANTGRKPYDPALNPANIATVQIGRVTAIVADRVFFDDVGINAYSGEGYDGLYVDKVGR